MYISQTIKVSFSYFRRIPILCQLPPHAGLLTLPDGHESQELKCILLICCYMRSHGWVHLKSVFDAVDVQDAEPGNGRLLVDLDDAGPAEQRMSGAERPHPPALRQRQERFGLRSSVSLRPGWTKNWKREWRIGNANGELEKRMANWKRLEWSPIGFCTIELIALSVYETGTKRGPYWNIEFYYTSSFAYFWSFHFLIQTSY